MEVIEKLTISIEETLDKMAFMFFEELEEAAEEDSPPRFDCYSTVGFSGVCSGRLYMSLTPATAEALCRNLMGLTDEDEVTQQFADDAVREFTNIVMGRTMTKLDPSEGFELDVPVVARDPFGEIEARRRDVLNAMLEDEPIRFVVCCY